MTTANILSFLCGGLVSTILWWLYFCRIERNYQKHIANARRIEHKKGYNLGFDAAKNLRKN